MNLCPPYATLVSTDSYSLLPYSYTSIVYVCISRIMDYCTRSHTRSKPDHDVNDGFFRPVRCSNRELLIVFEDPAQRVCTIVGSAMLPIV